MAGIIVLTLGYVMSQFYRSFLSLMSPILSADLQMDASELSYASGVWFLAFALMQFPIGVWLDEYGPRRTSTYLLAIGGAGGSILFATATSGLQIIFAMGLIGVGCAPVLMASFYLFARNYSAKNFALISSVLIGVGTLGNVIGSAPLAQAVEIFGWREVAFILAGISGLIAFCIMVFVRDPERIKSDASHGGVLDVLKIKSLWPIFLMLALSYSIAAGIRGLWAGPYLEDIFKLDIVEIGYVTLYMALALSVGSFFYAPMDRLFKTRKWVVFTGNLILLLAVVWLAYGQAIYTFNVTIAFVIIGLFGSSYGVVMAHGKEFVPKHLLGRGVTLLNFFSIGGVGVMQFLTGATFTSFRQEQVLLSGYTQIFILYAVLLSFALLCYAFCQDKKPV
ncbi:MAG: MFS transporter [Nitratireductor sp.]